MIPSESRNVVWLCENYRVTECLDAWWKNFDDMLRQFWRTDRRLATAQSVLSMASRGKRMPICHAAIARRMDCCVCRKNESIVSLKLSVLSRHSITTVHRPVHTGATTTGLESSSRSASCRGTVISVLIHWIHSTTISCSSLTKKPSGVCVRIVRVTIYRRQQRMGFYGDSSA